MKKQLSVLLAAAMLFTLCTTPAYAAGAIRADLTLHAGFHTSMAVIGDAFFTWGSNWYGEMGNGSQVRSDIPVKIMEDVIQISASTNQSYALKADGSLWAWGSNMQGQLGNGDIYGKDQPTPVKVMDGAAPPVDVTPPAPTYTANATASSVLVDGQPVSFDAYNIDGNNYFKLRDLAHALSGSAKQFEVTWGAANNAIGLITGKAYTPVGGEMAMKGTGAKLGIPTTSAIYLDGNAVSFTAYTIDGNNYFKLRDIGEAFDFEVDWDGSRNAILLDTNMSYTPD